MQTGKNAMETVKEKASNVAASARSGMEKTKATLQGQGEKMTAHGPGEKAMAEQRKEERKMEAELNKQDAQHQNAAQRGATNIAASRMGPGYTAGPEHMSGGHGVAGETFGTTTTAAAPMEGATTGTTRVTTRSKTSNTTGGPGTY